MTAKKGVHIVRKSGSTQIKGEIALKKAEWEAVRTSTRKKSTIKSTEICKQTLKEYFRKNMSRPIWIAGRRRNNPKCVCRVEHTTQLRKLKPRKNEYDKCDRKKGISMKEETEVENTEIKIFDLIRYRAAIAKVEISFPERIGILTYDTNNID